MNIDKLTLITRKGNIPVNEYLTFIKNCAQAGVTAVQLREKQLSYASLIEFGKQLQAILKPLQIPLIINDNVDLALELDADGVHLGQSDGCPNTARQRLGSKKIIGLSVDSFENVDEANHLPINYIGVGAIFPTHNKPDVSTFWDIHGLKKIAAVSKHPIIAVGGINEANAESVMQAGANGIAVIGAAHDVPDPAKSLKTIRHIIDYQGALS